MQLGAGGLAVGPLSAGVHPGPACYGHGGTLPTITDANALLGYLDPAARLGGRIGIDVERARAAIAPVAAALGLDETDTALGIVQVANATMARALRRVTVERGIDGRDCTLLAFGGGGPMHATGLAEMYGLQEIVVPWASSAFSALGCLTADLSFTQQQTVRLALDGLEIGAFEARLGALRDRALAPLLAGGAVRGAIGLSHVAMMRYEAQSDATAVAFAVPLDVAALRRDFQARHRALYGYATDEPCVIEALRVEAREPSGSRAARPPAGRVRAAGARVCSFQGARDVPTAIVQRDGLAGAVHGPAIIVDAWSTVVVPPGWRAAPDEAGHLRLRRGGA